MNVDTYIDQGIVDLYHFYGHSRWMLSFIKTLFWNNLIRYAYSHRLKPSTSQDPINTSPPKGVEGPSSALGPTSKAKQYRLPENMHTPEIIRSPAKRQVAEEGLDKDVEDVGDDVDWDIA
jgi:hypothetical protein